MKKNNYLRPDLVLPLVGGIWLTVFALRQLAAAVLLIPSAQTLEHIENIESVSSEDLWI